MRDCSFEKSDYQTYAKLKMEVFKSLWDLRDENYNLFHEE